MSNGLRSRRIFSTRSVALRPYDLDGPLQPEMTWAPLSYDTESGRGSYLLRMQPGAATIPHVHEAREEYLIVYEPGSHHGTRTVTGCLLLGIDWDPAPAGR